MGNSVIKQDLEDCLQKISSRDYKETEELIEKISKAYHDIIKQFANIEKEYSITILLYFIVKMFDIRQINFIGISLKEIPFTPLFLILSSYLFYRLTSVFIHKCHLFKMYATICEKSNKVFHEKMYHYFFIPNCLGLIEDIYETKFKIKNEHAKMIQDFKFFIYSIFVFALFVINILETENIDNTDTKSFVMVYVGMFIAIMLIIVSIKNMYYFLKIYKERKSNK